MPLPYEFERVKAMITISLQGDTYVVTVETEGHEKPIGGRRFTAEQYQLLMQWLGWWKRLPIHTCETLQIFIVPQAETFVATVSYREPDKTLRVRASREIDVTNYRGFVLELDPLDQHLT